MDIQLYAVHNPNYLESAHKLQHIYMEWEVNLLYCEYGE